MFSETFWAGCLAGGEMPWEFCVAVVSPWLSLMDYLQWKQLRECFLQVRWASSNPRPCHYPPTFLLKRLHFTVSWKSNSWQVITPQPPPPPHPPVRHICTVCHITFCHDQGDVVKRSSSLSTSFIWSWAQWFKRMQGSSSVLFCFGLFCFFQKHPPFGSVRHIRDYTASKYWWHLYKQGEKTMEMQHINHSDSNLWLKNHRNLIRIYLLLL